MYNLKQPHQVIVGKGKTGLVIQNGNVYERGSKKHLGPAHALMQDPAAAKLGYKACKVCGGTFTSAEKYGEHVYLSHRDLLVAEAQKQAPRGIKGTWSPSEEMIKEEAAKLSGVAFQKDEEAAPEAEATAEEAAPEPKPNPAKKKNWREKA